MVTYVRKASVDMTGDDWNRLKKCWTALNRKGIIDKYCNLHNSYAQHTMSGMRMVATGPRGNNLLFTFWHCALVAEFEKDLHNEDDNVILPYWDAAKEEGGPDAVRNFHPDIRRQNGGSRPQRRNWGDDEEPYTTGQIVDALSRSSYSEFCRILESGVHNQCHNYVGGDMATVSRAPGDILFWMHHCMMDYLWVIWRNRHSNAKGMPSGSLMLKPWNISCSEAYSYSSYQYLDPGSSMQSRVEAVPERISQPEAKRNPRRVGKGDDDYAYLQMAKSCSTDKKCDKKEDCDGKEKCADKGKCEKKEDCKDKEKCGKEKCETDKCETEGCVKVNDVQTLKVYEHLPLPTDEVGACNC